MGRVTLGTPKASPLHRLVEHMRASPPGGPKLELLKAFVSGTFIVALTLSALIKLFAPTLLTWSAFPELLADIIHAGYWGVSVILGAAVAAWVGRGPRKGRNGH